MSTATLMVIVEEQINAVNDSATTPNTAHVDIDVLANDSLNGGSAASLTPVVTAPPAHGTAIVQPDKRVRYTPAPGFVGTDTFQYRIGDAAPPPFVLPAAEVCVSEGQPGTWYLHYSPVVMPYGANLGLPQVTVTMPGAEPETAVLEWSASKVRYEMGEYSPPPPDTVGTIQFPGFPAQAAVYRCDK